MRKSIALLLLGFAASLSHAENKGTPAKLPKDIVPEHYLIHLEPNVERLATDGVESIEIRVLNPVNRIVLNAVEIEISAARIAHDGTQEELIPKFDAVQQTVFFETRERRVTRNMFLPHAWNRRTRDGFSRAGTSRRFARPTK